MDGESIRVNRVRPGLIDTEINASRPPGQFEEIARSVPMGRLGTAGEVGRSIVRLADGGASAQVTGGFIDARGGRRGGGRRPRHPVPIRTAGRP